MKMDEGSQVRLLGAAVELVRAGRAIIPLTQQRGRTVLYGTSKGRQETLKRSTDHSARVAVHLRGLGRRRNGRGLGRWRGGPIYGRRRNLRPRLLIGPRTALKNRRALFQGWYEYLNSELLCK